MHAKTILTVAFSLFAAMATASPTYTLPGNTQDPQGQTHAQQPGGNQNGQPGQTSNTAITNTDTTNTATTNVCSSGPVQCCNSVESHGAPIVKTLMGLLGDINLLADADKQAGLSCSPADLLDVGGTNCASQPVCCENNNFSGLVALGCTPINIGL